MEKQKKPQEKIVLFGGDGGDPAPAAPNAASPASVNTGGFATVAHGPYAENLPVVGRSVEMVRQRFTDRMGIDPTAEAFVNGKKVNEDYSLAEGDVLMFTKRAGEKGSL